MTGKFMMSADTPQEDLDWASLRWLSHPPSTDARELTVIEVNISPGGGHSFHMHPDQEEVIYVIAGRIEQWLDREKRMLEPGDSVFIKASAVHASFNASETEARMLAILGPCVGDQGYEVVEVADQAPWKSLR